jgi:hypothetical protein
LEEPREEPDRISRRGPRQVAKGNRMFEKRRAFLAVLIGAAAPLAIFARKMAAQGRPAPVPPPQSPGGPPQSSSQEGNPPDSLNGKSAAKAVLEANDKDIKKNVEKLFALASELKAEVDKTDSVQVLSLGMVKKAEEIEKLAKEIKTRAKG